MPCCSWHPAGPATARQCPPPPYVKPEAAKPTVIDPHTTPQSRPTSWATCRCRGLAAPTHQASGHPRGAGLQGACPTPIRADLVLPHAHTCTAAGQKTPAHAGAHYILFRPTPILQHEHHTVQAGRPLLHLLQQASCHHIIAGQQPPLLIHTPTCSHHTSSKFS
jgi:hypothetical protein